jgi:hypothetical protein
MTDVETRILELVAQLLERAKATPCDRTIVCPALRLDNGQVNLGRLEQPMQFIGHGRRGPARRYMLRMFVVPIGDDKPERDKIEARYRRRFRTEAA